MKLKRETLPLSITSLISGFVRAGILIKTTGHRRNRRFAYEPYIQLFRD